MRVRRLPRVGVNWIRGSEVGALELGCDDLLAGGLCGVLGRCFSRVDAFIIDGGRLVVGRNVAGLELGDLAAQGLQFALRFRGSLDRVLLEVRVEEIGNVAEHGVGHVELV